MNLLTRFIIYLFTYFFYGRPLPLSIGFLAQYVLKPVLGVLIAKAFGLSRIFYAGFVLTACVSGAQLSSYASFLSKGDVALSVLLTSSTTIASVLLTPLLTGLMIGSVVPVDAVAMSKSILQVISALRGKLSNKKFFGTFLVQPQVVQGFSRNLLKWVCHWTSQLATSL